MTAARTSGSAAVCKVDFWRAYCLFVAQVAPFPPERSEGANDATMWIQNFLDKTNIGKKKVFFDLELCRYGGEAVFFFEVTLAK